MQTLFFSIEKQHVQFKVEPNEENVDAARIAEALSKFIGDFSFEAGNLKKKLSEDDINIQKRINDNLGVDIAEVAAGKRVSFFDKTS